MDAARLSGLRDVLVPMVIGRRSFLRRVGRLLWRDYRCVPLLVGRRIPLFWYLNPTREGRRLPYGEPENVVRYLLDLAAEQAPHMPVLYVDGRDEFGLLGEYRAVLEMHCVVVALPDTDDAAVLAAALPETFPFRECRILENPEEELPGRDVKCS